MRYARSALFAAALVAVATLPALAYRLTVPHRVSAGVRTHDDVAATVPACDAEDGSEPALVTAPVATMPR